MKPWRLFCCVGPACIHLEKKAPQFHVHQWVESISWPMYLRYICDVVLLQILIFNTQIIHVWNTYTFTIDVSQIFQSHIKYLHPIFTRIFPQQRIPCIEKHLVSRWGTGGAIPRWFSRFSSQKCRARRWPVQPLGSLKRLQVKFGASVHR